MKSLRFLFFIILTSFLLFSCKKETYIYPNLLTEFSNLETDETGRGKYLLSDDGKRLEIENTEILGGLKKDTVYRVVCRYEVINSGNSELVNIYAIKYAIAPKPISISDFREIYTDAVELQSIWQKNDYLNIILRVKIKDTAHGLHFIENKIENESDGTRTLYLTLYHDRKNDLEAFYETSYLSVPLWSYSERLQRGDKIVFQLNTYKEGMTNRTFIY